MTCPMLSQSLLRRMFTLSAMVYLCSVLAVALPFPHPARPVPTWTPGINVRHGLFRIAYRDYDHGKWRKVQKVDDDISKTSMMLCTVSRCFGYKDGDVQTVREPEKVPYNTDMYYAMKAVIRMDIFVQNEEYLFQAFSSVAKLQTALKQKGLEMEILDPDSFIRAMMRLMLVIDSLIREGTYDEQKSIEENWKPKVTLITGKAWSFMAFGYHQTKDKNGSNLKKPRWQGFIGRGDIKIRTEPTHICYSLFDGCFGFDSEKPPEQVVPIRPHYQHPYAESYFGNEAMAAAKHPSLTIRLNETSPFLSGIWQRKNLEDEELVKLKTDLGNITKLEEVTGIEIKNAPSYVRAQLQYLASPTLQMLQYLDPKKPGPVELPRPDQHLEVLIKNPALRNLLAASNEKGKLKRPADSETPESRPAKKVAGVASTPSTSESFPSPHDDSEDMLHDVPTKDKRLTAARIEDHGTSNPSAASTQNVEPKPMGQTPSTESSVPALPVGPYFGVVLNA